MRVFLAVPPVGKGLLVDHTLTSVIPTLGLCYVASYIHAAGHEVILVDAAVERVSEKTFVKWVLDSKCQALLLTAHTVHVNTAGRVASMVKSANPSIITVLGGVHATLLPERTLNEQPGFDAVVIGEGEYSSVELLEYFASNGDGAPPSGTIVRKGERIISGGSRPPIQNLDALHFPMFDGLPLDKYERFFTRVKLRKLPLCTARGCPFRCIFCPRMMGDIQRLRSIDNVIEEIKRDRYRFGIEQLVFTDENIGLPPNRILELCNEIMKLPFRIPWFCETHVKTLTLETAKAMKAAGCEYVDIGVESGDPDILKSLGKRIDFDAVKNAVNAAKQAGLFVQANFIIGFPNETEESAQATIKLARELDTNMSAFSIMVPYPGTKIYEMAKKGEGGLRLLSENWDRYGKQFGGALELDTLPRYRMIQLQQKGFLVTNVKASKLASGYIPDFKTMLKFVLSFLWTLYESVRRKLFGHKKTNRSLKREQN